MSSGKRLGPLRARSLAWLRALSRHPWSWLRGAAGAAWQRVTASLWPVLQQTAAATVSWWIASQVIDHHEPIFAPITTLIALNASRGERGANAVRFVLGVVSGVLVAQVAITVMGSGYGTFAAAMLVSMIIALVVGGERVTIAQAAVSAILAIGIGGPGNGLTRASDALLGASVALVFSQLLFPSEPINLLRQAESAALQNLGDALHLTARALTSEDDEFSRWTWDHLRTAYNELAALSATRNRAGSAPRWTPPWWGQAKLVHRERANAARLDLLGNSCLALTRTGRSLNAAHRELFAPVVRDLASALHRLAAAPGDQDVRQEVAEHIVILAASVPAPEEEQDAELTMASATVRMVVHDILLFTGIGEDEAARAVQETAHDLQVGKPPRMRRTPFRGRGRRGPWKPR